MVFSMPRARKTMPSAPAARFVNRFLMLSPPENLKITTSFCHRIQQRFVSRSRIASTISWTRVSMILHLLSSIWVPVEISAVCDEKMMPGFQMFKIFAPDKESIDEYDGRRARPRLSRARPKKMHLRRVFLIWDSYYHVISISLHCDYTIVNIDSEILACE